MSSSSRSILALILAAAAWGTGTVVSKRAVAEIPPLTLLPIQLAASLVVLVLLMRWRRMPLTDPGAPSLLGRLGILNPGLAYALSLLGLAQISASLSVLLWALEPILILVLAAAFLAERVGRVVLALSLVAVSGMLLVAYQPGTSGNLLGVSLTVAGVLACAIYTVVTRRWIGTSDGTAPIVVAQQAHALAVSLVVVLALWLAGGAVRPEGVTTLGWASAVGSGVLYYGFAYWLYLSALRSVPASFAAASFYLVPVFGLAASFLLLSERLDPGQWLGVAVVSLAVIGILRRTGQREVVANVAVPVRAARPISTDVHAGCDWRRCPASPFMATVLVKSESVAGGPSRHDPDRRLLRDGRHRPRA
jgi:probable blue pigment (indigoidine) exporter